MVDILFDPQTSGGLLMAVPGRRRRTATEKMHRAGIKDAASSASWWQSPRAG